ncbi:MAG: SDR family oxidoreductase [Rhodospirillaceae bacterium]|nr:SDR family oxidoreductase [Rhodospirillaceae bacterium]
MTKVIAKPLADAAVLITGGTSGIGLAAAQHFVRAGVRKIVLNGRNPERGAKACATVLNEAAGVTVKFVAADISNLDDARRLTDETVKALDGIDVLVNCAGGDHAPELFHEMSIGDIQKMLIHFVAGPTQMCHLVLPHMTKAGGGAIINVASDAAKFPTPGESVIGGCMAALVMFTKTLAMEAKRAGIRANALTPSIVEGTRTYDRVMGGGFSAKLFDKAIKAARLGVVTPDDIAPMIVFMAGPQGARMTGQAISINGGISAG